MRTTSSERNGVSISRHGDVGALQHVPQRALSIGWVHSHFSSLDFGYVLSNRVAKTNTVVDQEMAFHSPVLCAKINENLHNSNTGSTHHSYLNQNNHD